MDNSDIKNLLKTAKETIKNKEFKETLKICKSVIDKEKENYLAWVKASHSFIILSFFFINVIILEIQVFTGAAAQELGNKEQSIAAFQRAIQISPNQAPAWQV
jgi:superkiller protein 3